MKYLLISWIAGALIDLIAGDPHWLWHPVQGIGALISALDKRLYPGSGSDSQKFIRGVILTVLVLIATLAVSGGMLLLCYRIHPVLGIVLQSVMTAQCLAAHSLKKESMEVYHHLAADDVEGARKAVSMIVGRDTAVLDRAGITRAAVETVAENASDGVIAPMFWMLIGGPVGGFLYKAVNTMDSMIGYHNDRYEYFGRAAARLDDAANFLPSRISAVLMIAAAGIPGLGMSARRAWQIWRRDRFNHRSPNSAQTESAAAGALGLRLAGDAYYFGRLVKKPYIGDETRPIEDRDIVRVNRLMYLASAIGWLIVLCIILIAQSV